ncbi:hypothetical protein [Actinomadura kijaniata]|uniref:hypothetical protein n=1 Tax=Actinomadura kijaniata TaxID=46161 RepID=UPI0008310B55|nr:hypothetical protein [Actinomadura kijaniata]
MAVPVGHHQALAREHHVAPKTIRRVLDAAEARQLPAELDALPVPEEPSGPAADAPVTLDLPGLLADHLRAVGDDAIRQALIWRQIAPRRLHSLALSPAPPHPGLPVTGRGLWSADQR